MSDEFVETGQTLTQDGAPYCPVERKRRGAMGVFASLGVLTGGAVFLTYAMMGTSVAPVAAQPETGIVAVSTDSGLKPDSAAFTTEPAAPASLPITTATTTTVETAAPSSSRDLIAEALAESRSARAAVPTREPKTDYSFTVPSIKPGAVASNNGNQTTDGFAPSLKPSAQTIAFKTSNAVLDPAHRPVSIQAMKAAARQKAITAAPSIIFLPDNLEHRKLIPAIAYSQDISRDTIDTTITIARGETFVDALKRAGVKAADRNSSAYAFGEHYNLRRLRPGQEFKLTLGWPNQTLFQHANGNADEAHLLSLEFRDGIEKLITVTRNQEDGFEGDEAPIPLTTHLHAIEGHIDGSLYLSAKSLGAPDAIIAGLADAFAYDVDFQREIFGGDEFEVIFEARYDDLGQMVAGGDIIYARLNWRGKSREKGYYRFTDNQDDIPDFYDATGQSAKRLLMKTPIDGARLSSRFGKRRHPILGYARAHKGVDFAARRGTPIKAAGDGIIERADRYGSFGNYVRIRHANNYKTAYAHLKGFRRGIRKGKRVRQGDIIGYVGTTGRSTGPHLHYEVHHKGVAVNPQKLKIATGKQLKGAELDRFKLERERIDAMRQPAVEPPPLYAADQATEKESL